MFSNKKKLISGHAFFYMSIVQMYIKKNRTKLIKNEGGEIFRFSDEILQLG